MVREVEPGEAPGSSLPLRLMGSFSRHGRELEWKAFITFLHLEKSKLLAVSHYAEENKYPRHRETQDYLHQVKFELLQCNESSIVVMLLCYLSQN